MLFHDCVENKIINNLLLFSLFIYLLLCLWFVVFFWVFFNFFYFILFIFLVSVGRWEEENILLFGEIIIVHPALLKSHINQGLIFAIIYFHFHL